jgi:predicted Zn-dependent peptidase
MATLSIIHPRYHNIEYSVMDLPGTNFFKFEIHSEMGAHIERSYPKTLPEHETKNIYGISHLIEHMSFKSPADYTTDGLMANLKRYGTYNAWTNFEEVAYYFETLADRENVMWAISMVFNIAFNDLSKVTQEEFETERNVVYNEIKRYHDDAQTMFSFRFSPNIYGNNEFDDILGDPETLIKFDLETLQEVKRIFINEAPLTMTITYDSTRMNLDDIFSMIDAEREKLNPMHPKLEYTYDMYLEGIKSVEWDYRIKQVASDASQHLYMAAIRVPVPEMSVLARACASYIGQSAHNESLNEIIREQHGLTYGISFSVEEMTNKELAMVFSCDVEPQNADLLDTLFVDTLRAVVENLTEEKFNNYKETLLLKDTMALLNQRALMNLHNWPNNCTDFGKYEELFKEDGMKGREKVFAEVLTYPKFLSYCQRVVAGMDSMIRIHT